MTPFSRRIREGGCRTSLTFFHHELFFSSNLCVQMEPEEKKIDDENERKAGLKSFFNGSWAKNPENEHNDNRPPKKHRLRILLFPFLNRWIFISPQHCRRIRVASRRINSTADLAAPPLFVRYSRTYAYVCKSLWWATLCVSICVYYTSASQSLSGPFFFPLPPATIEWKSLLEETIIKTRRHPAIETQWGNIYPVAATRNIRSA